MKLLVKYLPHICIVFVVLLSLPSLTSAQRLSKGRTYTGGRFMAVLDGSMQGFLTAGFSAAGYQQTANGYGWLGFYPLQKPKKLSSVHEHTAGVTVWPQPATSYVYVRGVKPSFVGNTMLRTVRVADVYGRQIELHVSQTDADVFRVDVSPLAIGTYVLLADRDVLMFVGG